MVQTSNTRIKSLHVYGWRQFGNIDIEVHPRLTVITGANASGKSSLLRIFSRHLGFNRPYLATPVRNQKGGYSYITGLFSRPLGILWKLLSLNRAQEDKESVVGSIQYENGTRAELTVPRNEDVSYNLKIRTQQNVSGIHIDSHQPVSSFQQVGSIPTTVVSPSIAFHNYNREVINRYQGNGGGQSPVYKLKEAVIAMAMFGEGNSQVQGNDEVLRAYQGFIRALKTALPSSLGFIDLSIRPPEVVITTTSGEFIIDEASGGLMVLIDLIWRLHMFSLTAEQFVVTIDEPENHLHPSMQRSLLKQLIEAFPNAQFIVATHSPFIVSSVKDSFVYVLRYFDASNEESASSKLAPTERRRVVSERLDTVSKAGNASEILREVLGVPSTIPQWVEEALGEIVEKYRRQEITIETLGALRAELSRLGYDDLYSNALTALVEKK